MLKVQLQSATWIGFNCAFHLPVKCIYFFFYQQLLIAYAVKQQKSFQLGGKKKEKISDYKKFMRLQFTDKKNLRKTIVKPLGKQWLYSCYQWEMLLHAMICAVFISWSVLHWKPTNISCCQKQGSRQCVLLTVTVLIFLEDFIPLVR